MSIRALLFDVGGTVFDWRSAVVAGIKSLPALTEQDAEDFSAAWRERSLVEIEAIAAEQEPWRPFDAVLESSLRHCLRQMNCDELSDRENKYLLSAWERMPAWPEAPAALSRLQDHFFLAPLTILSLRVAAHSSRFAGLTWDAIISCDALGVTKPHPESYRRALAAIGRSGEEVLFVAAHPSDLRAAREHGMKTAYVVARLFDYGDDYKDTGFAQEFDVVAADFSDLAEQILARA